MGRGWERVLTTSCTVTADGLVTIDDQATSDDTSAPDLPHPPQLGLARPLADYIPEYGLDAALERVPYDAEFEPVALKEIRKVCKLGGEADVIIKQDADRVTISTLNTILKLSQSPLYLRHFESTPLISGCIKLMASVAIANNSSLFSYEYGYLCFKVLTIAIGVCLLARSHKLTPLIEQMMADQNTPMLQLFSIEVSQLVKEEIEDADNNPIACDWLLGWAKAPERAQEPPLASRYDIITLSKILFDDCKSFMKAWSSTFSPGLSGVVFLLWRYVHNKCIVNTSPRPEAKLIPLCEIIWRCMIMATKDEVIPLMYMFNTVQSAGVRMWEKHCRTPAGRSDVEDFRTILELFLMRLAPTNPERYSKFGFAEMAAVIPFVAGRVRGCEDLFPKLFKMAFDRAIEAHDIQEFDDMNLICATGGTLVYLGNCLQMVENSLPYKPEILMQLVTILAENRVFALVARTVVILKQTITLGDDAECYEAARNHVFRVCCGTLFQNLEKLVPQSTLEDAFRSYIPEWLTFNRHLFTLRFRVEGEPHPKWDHYKLCQALWVDIAKDVGLESRIKAILDSGRRCSYARCPAPDELGGGEVTCGVCLTAIYCSFQCQARDWEYDFGSGSHRENCARELDSDSSPQ